MAKKSNITISVECGYSEWWRYNVYITAATFRDGERVDYQSLSDVVYPTGNGSEVRLRPAGYDPCRPLSLEIAEAERLELFIYVIPNTMPIDSAVRQSPPFEIRVKARGAGINLSAKHTVNQWGGASLHITHPEE